VLAFSYEPGQLAVLGFTINNVRLKAGSAVGDRLTGLRNGDLYLFDYIGKRAEKSMLALVCQTAVEENAVKKLEKYGHMVIQL
jgi:hypothetical protein